MGAPLIHRPTEVVQLSQKTHWKYLLPNPSKYFHFPMIRFGLIFVEQNPHAFAS